MFREVNRLIRRRSARIKSVRGRVGVSWAEAGVKLALVSFHLPHPHDLFIWALRWRQGHLSHKNKFTVWSMWVFLAHFLVEFDVSAVIKISFVSAGQKFEAKLFNLNHLWRNPGISCSTSSSGPALLDSLSSALQPAVSHFRFLLTCPLAFLYN